jgi:tubulin epsilon
MPREIIAIQVGQCGNQLGCRFWELALREHAAHNPSGKFVESMSSFFRNVDSRNDSEIPVGQGDQPIRTLKARAIPIDMEEGVLNQLMRGPLSDLFESRQLIHDVSGAGNNW